MAHFLRLLLTAAITLASAGVASVQVPAELESSRFSGSELTPCPACLCLAPTGEVYVGVDLNGSLGKGPEKGRIVRLADTDNDGKAAVLVTLKDKTSFVGFVSAETADGIEVRDIAGQVTKVKTDAIATRQDLPLSMMPEGLANALTIEQFAGMLAYLQGMKE